LQKKNQTNRNRSKKLLEYFRLIRIKGTLNPRTFFWRRTTSAEVARVLINKPAVIFADEPSGI
jgi:ABC-type ATPase involved in cell division